MPTSPALVQVLDAHRFDEAALKDWLGAAIPDFGRDFSVRQFQGGQSNPTFLLQSGARKLVLRKKPPGKLLPKAHSIEREYRVLRALSGTDVPVPKVRAICEDADVIGTAFYLMDYVEGRFFDHPAMPDATPADRRLLHAATVDSLASLHSVDFDRCGLSDFGPRTGYVSRQVERWTGQYRASQAAGELPALQWLADWLHERRNVADETTIAHGDFRPGNLCFRDDAGAVSAILDWELSTLGHPLSDMAYLCMPYHIPWDVPNGRGLKGMDLGELGIPSEAESLERYSRATGRASVQDWPLFLALSFFRLSAILHGVMARAIAGNASNADARNVAGRAVMLAETGQAIARSGT